MAFVPSEAYILRNWNRLEPRPYSADVNEGLKAGLGDAAYMLSKQRALGEFTGHDGGSPVSLRFERRQSELTEIQIGDAFEPFDFSLPEEAMIERVAYRPTLKTTVLWGQRLRRFVDAALFTDLASEFPINSAFYLAEDVPRVVEDDLWIAVAEGGGVPDGWALVQLSANDVVTALGLVGPEASSAIAQIDAWRAAIARQTGALASAGNWLPEGLHYETASKFEGSTGQGNFSSPSYKGHRKAWYQSDLVQDGAASSSPESVETLATSLSFAGMPTARWWAYEDGVINLSALNPNVTDLVTMVMAQFALQYGNDWFLTALDGSLGSWSEVSEVIVTTTFGERIRIERARDLDWAFLAQSKAPSGGLDPRLLTPASARDTLNGPSDFVTVFAIDEMTNVAWAIESEVLSAAGERVHQRSQGSIFTEASDTNPELPRYSLGEPPPRNWIPYIPISDGRLKRGAARLADGILTRPVSPVVQETSHPVALPLDALTQEGLIIEEGARRSRWLGGQPVIWRARRRRVGKGAIVAADVTYDTFGSVR